MKNILGLLVLGSLMLFTSCEDDLGSSNIKIPAEEMSDTDEYLYDAYTKTFNVDVLYKWNEEESDLSKNLVPPYESQVKPYMESVIRGLWLNTYLTQVDSSFLRKYVPKQILLLGTANYNSDGTITLGTADAGKKITLYQVNDYKEGTASAMSQALQSVHVIHHEFAHILHQTVSFSEVYKTLTPEYTSSWYLIDDTEAWSKGFVTNYAMSSYEEDFVEMLSCMLTSTPTAWRNRIDNAPNDVAKAALKQKEAIVKEYMSSVWKIDMDVFQKTMTDALNGYSYLAEPSPEKGAKARISIDHQSVNNSVNSFCEKYGSYSCLHLHLPKSWVLSNYSDWVTLQINFDK